MYLIVFKLQGIRTYAKSFMTMMILELTYNPNLKFWQAKWQKIVTFLALQDVKHKNIKMMNVLRS